MNEWSTHIHALSAAVQHSSGPILELGCGDYSTPLLHVLRGDRLVVSAERDPAWYAQFVDLAAAGHEVVLVSDWDAFLEIVKSTHWGVVFVDHSPGERRAADLRLLAPRTDLVVVHDTEASCYGWAGAFDAYDWVFTHQRHPTWATIAGHGPRPDWVERDLVPGKRGPPQCWR